MLERGVFPANFVQARNDVLDVAWRVPVAGLELILLAVEVFLAGELPVVAVAQFEEIPA